MLPQNKEQQKIYLYRTMYSNATLKYITLIEYKQWLFNNITPVVKLDTLNLDDFKSFSVQKRNELDLIKNDMDKTYTLYNEESNINKKSILLESFKDVENKYKKIVKSFNTLKTFLDNDGFINKYQNIDQDYIDNYFENISKHNIPELKMNNVKVYSDLKANSFYITQKQGQYRSMNIEGDYLPFIIIDVDYDNPELRALQLPKIIEYFKSDSNTLYITKSFSEKGIHIYYNVKWDKEKLTHLEHRYRYALIAKYLTGKVGFNFMDLSMANSVQPEFCQRKPLYINKNATSFEINYPELYTDNIGKYIDYLTSNRNTELNSKLDYTEYDETVNLQNRAYLNYDKHNKLITDEIITVYTGDYELTEKEQVRAIKSRLSKHLSKEYITKRLSEKPSASFYKELLHTLPFFLSCWNLDKNIIYNTLKDLIPNSVNYISALNGLINLKTTKDKVFRNVEHKEISKEYLNNIVKNTVKNTVEVDSVLLNSGEHIDSLMFDSFSNYHMLIADTKTGKTYGIIDWVRKNYIGKCLLIVPVNVLKSEFLSNKEYGLKEFNGKTKIQSGEIYCGTYDAFIMSEYKNDNDLFLIVDEFHTVLTEYYREIMSDCLDILEDKLQKRILLMSATPTFKLDGYTESIVRFKTVQQGELVPFTKIFKKYVLTNLDTNKVNLVYVNNVEKTIQEIYKYYRDEHKMLCKLIISDKNISFLKEYRADLDNPEYTHINTYLTTKVVEVGIGLPQFINNFYINPYNNGSEMGLESFEQLLNRDNRKNLIMSEDRNIHIYLKPDKKYVKADSFIRDDDSVRLHSENYKSRLLEYLTPIKIAYRISPFEMFYKSRYVKYSTSFESLFDIELEKSIKLALKNIELKEYKEMDFNLLKIDRLFDLIYPFKNYASEYVLTEWMKNVDLKMYKYNLETVKLFKEYPEINSDIIKAGTKVDTNKLNEIVKNYRLYLLKTNSDINVKTERKLRIDLLNLFNAEYNNPIYTFNKLRVLGFIEQVNTFEWIKDKHYSKADIKIICAENGLIYKEEVVKFKERQLLINNARCKVMVLN